MKKTLINSLLVLTILLGPSACSQSDSAPRSMTQATWFVYRDAESSENHGVFANWMPAESATMIRLDVSDGSHAPAGQTDIQVNVKFASPYWCGVAVAATPNYWGEAPSDAAFNLTGARKLVFRARGDTGGERIQVKVAIAGDKPFGDSARVPAETDWIELANDWRTYTLSVDGMNLSRVITPFCFVTNRDHNTRNEITFYLDDIRFETTE